MLKSAGILLYRVKNGKLEVLLVHPGGPFWAKKDYGAWSIPKGLVGEGEEVFGAAKREFKEETGFEADGKFLDLGEILQPSRKSVHVWAVEGDLDTSKISSNTFEIEWPKNSGLLKRYPEVDRAEWFELNEAKRKILKGQIGFLERLAKMLNLS